MGEVQEGERVHVSAQAEERVALQMLGTAGLAVAFTGIQESIYFLFLF